MTNKILLLLVLGVLVVMSQAMAASEVPAEVNPVQGASFTEVTDVGGIEGSSFYLYLPSELYNPAPMLTPVIYVYGDKRYQDIRDAWAALTAAGLDTIAEAEHGAVIMVNSVGNRWAKVDIDVFEAIEAYIFRTCRPGKTNLSQPAVRHRRGNRRNVCQQLPFAELQAHCRRHDLRRRDW